MKLANRSEELNFFMRMMRQTGPQRILLIQASSGIGKTNLLEKFRDSCPDTWRLLALDLKGATSGVIYFISRLQRQLGHTHFYCYEQAVRELLASSIDIANNRIVGDENIFQVLLQNVDDYERHLRFMNLQDAFFLE